MVPKISLGMIQDCLGYVTTVWFGKHDLSADPMSEYDSDIEDMRRYAIRRDNLIYLKLGFEYILGGGAFEDRLYEQLSGECWDFDKEELLEIMMYIYSVIWSEGKKPEINRVPKIDLIHMSRTSSALSEWDVKKYEFNPGFDESKIEYV